MNHTQKLQVTYIYFVGRIDKNLYVLIDGSFKCLSYFYKTLMVQESFKFKFKVLILIFLRMASR